MLSFIRTYYIFIYYKIAVVNKNKNGKPDTLQAYIGMSMFINAMPLFLLFVVLERNDVFFFPELYELIKIPLWEVHRGTITGGVLLIGGISSLITYLICCFRVPFEKISIRLSKYEFFHDEAGWKAVTPVVVQMIIVFIFL